MAEPASFKEELFLVLIPGGEVLELAQRIQKRISNYYKIYEDNVYPQMHLTLDRVKSSHKNEVKKTLADFIKEIDKSVTIEIEKFKCFYLSSNNFLVLKVADTKSLLNFGEELHQKLASKNLSTIEEYKEWQYHITLISNLFADNPLSDRDFEKLCFIFDNLQNQYVSEAEKLELWRPTLNFDKKVIKSYGLRGGNN